MPTMHATESDNACCNCTAPSMLAYGLYRLGDCCSQDDVRLKLESRDVV